MKKFSKKQKLIAFIAILLIAIILTIVITTNIAKNNIVANEDYAVTTANANSNLVAGYIKEGITIGGITGTLESLNTFDATARPEDITKGKTAYVKGEKITGTYIEPISNDDLQISTDNVYYADINDDGTVDGIIFADLAGKEERGEWGSNGWGTYTIPEGTNLKFKQYYIKGEYIEEHFGPGKVIAPTKENDESKNNRFYVMALEDIDSSTHYWYYNAYGNLKGPFISYEANDLTTAGEEPTGKTNTEIMIASWNSSQYGAQNSNDMWGLIQDKIADGWFVPSKSEWAAFGAVFDITGTNYFSTFGLSRICWSSSQYSTYHAYRIDFDRGLMHYDYVYASLFVRLATTF